MTDTTKPINPDTTTVPVGTPAPVAPTTAPVDLAQQSLQQASDQVQAQAQQLADTAQQIAADPTKVVGMMNDQLGNIASAVGAQDLLKDTTDRFLPMQEFVIHTIKMAFFLETQQRASRGEFMVGALSATIIMSVVSALLPMILGGFGLFLTSILILIPILNLGVKRFHDMNKPGRWAAMLLIPIFGWVMPLLFKSVNHQPAVDGMSALSNESLKRVVYTNDYGNDPAQTAPQSMEGYIIIVLSLFIVSSLLVTILSFIGVRVSTPSVDSVSDTDAAVTQTQGLKSNTSNTLNTTKNTVTTTTKNL